MEILGLKKKETQAAKTRITILQPDDFEVAYPTKRDADGKPVVGPDGMPLVDAPYSRVTVPGAVFYVQVPEDMPAIERGAFEVYRLDVEMQVKGSKKGALFVPGRLLAIYSGPKDVVWSLDQHQRQAPAKKSAAA